MLDQIGKIRRLTNEREKIKQQLDGKRVSAQRRRSLLDGVAKYGEKIINALIALQLNRKQTEAIADGLKRAMERMQSLERRVRDFEHRVGKLPQKFSRLVAEADGRKKNWQKITGSLRMGHEAISAYGRGNP